MLAQIAHRTGRVERVARGSYPVIELDLGANEEVVSFHAAPMPARRERVTDDWRWTAWVVNRLGEDKLAGALRAAQSALAHGDTVGVADEIRAALDVVTGAGE